MLVSFTTYARGLPPTISGRQKVNQRRCSACEAFGYDHVTDAGVWQQGVSCFIWQNNILCLTVLTLSTCKDPPLLGGIQ